MGYKIGIDVGGTFTDLIIWDEEDKIDIFKAASTPENPVKGLFDVLGLAAKQYQLTLKGLLGNCERFAHGSTLATNSIIERKAAKTGLICTEGFRHILYLRNAGKLEPYNIKMKYPEPYIPIYLTLPVRERVNAEGGEEVPLNEEDVRQACAQFKRYHVEAVAICLLWAMANADHERRVSEIVKQELPEVAYSLSSEVQPVIREYERTCATAIDASLKPIMSNYIRNLQQSLTDNGLEQQFLMATSSGGIMSASEIMEKPIYTTLSGPAMGPVVGKFFGEKVGADNIIIIDMGGTSFDVSIIMDGQITTTRNAKVGTDPLGITAVDVSTIGAGGGSITWIDAGGLLHVGPKSAGAHPGPACYGRGGEESTVTDADLLLGYLNKANFLGGQIKLYPELSHKVIEEKVAKPLKLRVEEASSAIIDVVNQNMINSIEDLTIRRGIDPRQFLLVVLGGAGPVHAAAIARGLGISEVYIPRLASGGCALGTIVTDIKFDSIKSHYTESQSFDFEGVNRVLAELESRGRVSLEEERVATENTRFDYFVEGRYPFQVWGLEIPLGDSKVTPGMIPQMVENFHRLHEKRYGTREKGQYVEFHNWRVTAIGITPAVSFSEQPFAGQDASFAVSDRRRIYSKKEGASVESLVYQGSKLAYGNTINGPAVIEEATTTIVVPAGSRISVNEWGDYLMKLD
jgi:N-methylhydantoinase A